MIDWLNTNSGAITAFATITVAIATICYVIINHKLWKSMEKQSNRPRKIGEIRHILKPLINNCERENKTIDEKRVRYLHKHYILFNQFNKTYTVGVVFNTFIDEHSKLKEIIEKHDILVKKLINEVDNFTKHIITNDFRLKVENKIIEFDLKRGRDGHVDESTINLYCDCIIDCLIEDLDKDNINKPGEFASFWKDYYNDFIEMKKEKDIKRILNQIYSISKDLKDNNNLMLEQLNIISNEYLKDGLSLGLNQGGMAY